MRPLPSRPGTGPSPPGKKYVRTAITAATTAARPPTLRNDDHNDDDGDDDELEKRRYKSPYSFQARFSFLNFWLEVLSPIVKLGSPRCAAMTN